MRYFEDIVVEESFLLDGIYVVIFQGRFYYLFPFTYFAMIFLSLSKCVPQYHLLSKVNPSAKIDLLKSGGF